MKCNFFRSESAYFAENNMNFLLRIEYILLFDFGVINTTNGDYEKHVPSVALRDAVYIHNFIHHRMVAKKIIGAVCFSFCSLLSIML